MKFHHFILMLLLLTVSCQKPRSVENFCRVDDKQDGMFVFDVDMSDSLSCYDVDFYTQIDGAQPQFSIPMDIIWTSPSGRQFGERVYFTDADSHARIICFPLVRQACIPYRKDIVPVESGIWKLSIVADAPGLTGMGMILYTHEKDGTR